jgi:hypothetical protein
MTDYAPLDFSIEQVPDTEWETLVSAGITLAQDMDARRFDMGDLGALVTTRYGDNSLGKFSSAIGMANADTLRRYVKVARTFEKRIRVQYLEAGLTFSHFRVAAADGENAEYWLAKAADDGLPVAALAREIKQATGKPVPPRKLYDGRGMFHLSVSPSGYSYVMLEGDVSALANGQIVIVKLYAEAQ